MIIIFTGPPFSGKDTQAKMLGGRINLPVFSMGALIRDAYERKDPRAVEGFEKYSMKGMHVPVNLKFELLKDKIEETVNGCIIDNFPGTQEDLETFNNYIKEKKLKVDYVFYLNISKEEMLKRMVYRGRDDDKPEIVLKRRENQDRDREKVLEFYKKEGLLREIDGTCPIDEIHNKIISYIYG